MASAKYFVPSEKNVKQIPRSDWKIVLNTHTAIIPQELFDSVQCRINLCAKSKPRTYKWVLNGIVMCKECGEPMGLKVKYRKDGRTISFMRLYCLSSLHRKGECIRKHKGIELNAVTQIVIKNLNKKINNITKYNHIDDLIKKSFNNKSNSNYEKELKIKERQLEKCNKLISALYIDYKNEIIQECDFKSMYNQEIQNRESINTRIEELKNKMNTSKTISNKEFKQISEKVSNVKNWTKEQLANVIDTVEIDIDDNIYINYKYDIMEMV